MTYLHKNFNQESRREHTHISMTNLNIW